MASAGTASVAPQLLAPVPVLWRRLLLGLAVLLALGLRLSELRHVDIINTDAAAFLPGWKYVLGPGTWQDAAHPSRYATWPPLYPVLSIELSRLLGGNLELGARLVSLLAGLGLVVAVYLLAGTVGGGVCGLVAAFLAACCPSLVTFSLIAYPTTLYTLLVTVAALVLYRALQASGPLRWGAPALIGACLGLAFLCRPETTMLLAIALAWLLWRALRRSEAPEGSRPLALRCLPVLAAVVAFAAFAGPYVAAIRLNMGEWRLSKTGNLRLGVERPADEEQERWALNADHTDLASTEEAESDLAFLWTHRAALARKYARNWATLLSRRFPELAPLVLWVLLAAALATRALRRTPGLLALVSLSAPLVVLPAFLVTQVRMFAWLVPLVLVFASVGICEVGGRLAAACGSARQWPGVAALTAAIALAVLLPAALPSGLSARRGHRGGEPYEIAGRFLRSHFGPGQRIIARKAWVPFYADGEAVMLPSADVGPLTEYALHKGARFLVIDPVAAQLQPQLAPLLNPSQAPRSWRAVYQDSFHGQPRMVIYDLSPRQD